MLNTVLISISPRPAISPPPSVLKGSEIDFPSIWSPPQIPKIGIPRDAALRISASRPFCRIHLRSEIVDFVPGMMIISGEPSSATFLTYRSDTPEKRSNGEKSVKLDMRGSRITAISISLRPPQDNRLLRLSSSSISTCIYGMTPAHGILTSL